MVGPGAVLGAAQGILAAIERGDGDALQGAFAPMAEVEGVQLARGEDGELEPVTPTMSLAFAEVAADGTPIMADDPAAAIRQLLTAVAGTGGAIEHRILAVRADCPSGSCSWGVVDLERTIRRGKDVKVLPLRLALLTRHFGDVPHMRPFVWQMTKRP